MKLIYLSIISCLLNGCSLMKNKEQENLKQLSAENYNYQELLKKQYKIKISEIVYDDPNCGTRAEAADLIGEVEGLGTIRILILCTSMKNIKENDTLCFLPISKPNFQVSSVYYLIEELTESDIQKIIKIPSTFATVVRCE